MKTTAIVLPALLLSFLLCTVPARAQYTGGDRYGSEEQVKVQAAADVLTDAISLAEGKIPDFVLRNAYGIAIIPNIARDALYAGGARGEGVLLVRTDLQTWSAPAFISLSSTGTGAQIGPYATDIVVIFRTKESLAALQNGTLPLGARIRAAAGPTEGNPESMENLRSSIGIYTYARNDNGFTGLNPRGIALQYNNGANERFYGMNGITPESIFSGGPLISPSGLNPLTCLMAHFTGTAQIC